MLEECKLKQVIISRMVWVKAHFDSPKGGWKVLFSQSHWLQDFQSCIHHLWGLMFPENHWHLVPWNKERTGFYQWHKYLHPILKLKWSLLNVLASVWFIGSEMQSTVEIIGCKHLLLQIKNELPVGARTYPQSELLWQSQTRTQTSYLLAQ